MLGSLGFRRSALVRAEELRRVRAPTLLIWGDRDPVGTVEAARVTAELIPQAQLEVLPGGHVPYLWEPRADGRAAVLLRPPMTIAQMPTVEPLHPAPAASRAA